MNINNKDGDIHEVKLAHYNQGGPGEFTHTKFVHLNAKTQGFLCSTSQGSISILPYERPQEINSVSVHYSGINHIVISPDNKTLFTAGQDGSIFIFDILPAIFDMKDHSIKPQMVEDDGGKKGLKDPRAKVVDPELADIVFVKRD